MLLTLSFTFGPTVQICAITPKYERHIIFFLRTHAHGLLMDHSTRFTPKIYNRANEASLHSPDNMFLIASKCGDWGIYIYKINVSGVHLPWVINEKPLHLPLEWVHVEIVWLQIIWRLNNQLLQTRLWLKMKAPHILKGVVLRV